MSKFKKTFASPVYMDGSYYLDGDIPKEEAIKIFSQYEDIDTSSLKKDRVRFRADIIDGEFIYAWFTGAGDKPGTKPVWVSDWVENPCKDKGRHND